MKVDRGHPCRGLTLALATVLPFTPLHLSRATAQIECAPPGIDFGERGHDERPAETLVLRNVGSAPVSIQNIRRSCDCLRVEPPAIQDAIAPGGSLELVVSMSSGRAIGALEKYIALETSQGALKIPVKMRVFTGLRLEPRDLRFEGVFGGEPVVEHVDVALEGGAAGQLDLRSGGVRDPARGSRPNPHFDALVVDGPKGKRIEVTLRPTHPEGRIHSQLEARLNGRLLLVPISGEMFRWIKVSPTYFNFSRVSADDPSSFFEEAELASTDGREFRILSMEPTFRTLKPEGTRLELGVTGGEIGRASTRHRLRARIVPPELTATGPSKDGTLGSFSGQVIVKTDHPEKPEIVFGVFGFFAAPKKQE